MEEALVLRADSLVFYTDSQLICRQIKKEYKVKSKNIVGLYNQAQRLRSIFKAVSIVNIPRVENRGADKLANLAIKKQIPA
jgi:ribonuclease HI